MSKALMRLLAQRGYLSQEVGGEGGSSGGGGVGAQGAGTQTPGSEQTAAGAEGQKQPSEAPKSGMSDSEAELLREVMDRKRKQRELSDELERARQELERFKGLNPDEVRALLKERQEAATRKLEEQGQWEALKKQMSEQHQSIVAELEAKNGEAASQVDLLKKQIAELTVGNAFGASKFISDKMTLPNSKVRALLGSHFEFNGERVVGYDKPAGSPGRVMLVDARGEALGFDAAIEKLVSADPDADRLIRSSVRPGANSRTSGVGSAPRVQENLTGRSRIVAALSQNALKK